MARADSGGKFWGKWHGSMESTAEHGKIRVGAKPSSRICVVNKNCKQYLTESKIGVT
jgi:hypothetical protein